MKENPIGIMQGRLLPPVGNSIQAFPEELWQKEFVKAQTLGLDCIEFIFEGADYKKHPLMTEEGINKIKELEAQTSIKVLSVCADYFMDFPLHKGSDIKSSCTILKQLLSQVSLLSVKEIIIPCVDRSRLSDLTEKKQFVKSLGDMLPLAEEYKLNLTLETDLPPKAFLELIKELDSPYVRINYDTGNSASLGYDPEEEIELYGKWVTDVHIKDRLCKGGTVPLGEGNANFTAVFKKLTEIDFSGIFIFQTARKETGKEQETIAWYMDFLRSYWN